MNTHDSTATISAPPPSFIGLVFSLGGWALSETAILSGHFGLRSHLVPTLLGLYLVSTSTRQMKLPRHLMPAQAAPAPQGSSPLASQAGWSLLLLTAGLLMGLLIMGGSTLVLGMTAFALTLAPWSRISFCRERMVGASLVMCAGMALPLLLAHRRIDTIFLLVSGWLFWGCATYAVLGRIGKLWRAERELKAMSRLAPAESA